MFIAGSHTARDWFDDITKVPAWGDLRNSDRYQKVQTKFEEQDQIDTVVGHSLGGSVSLELQKNYPERKLKSRTYGAPVMDLLGSESENVDRYRNWFDPVSVFDRGAKKSIKWNVLDSGSLTHTTTATSPTKLLPGITFPRKRNRFSKRLFSFFTTHIQSLSLSKKSARQSSWFFKARVRGSLTSTLISLKVSP